MQTLYLGYEKILINCQSEKNTSLLPIVNKNPLRRLFNLRASLRSLKLLRNLANRHGVATKGF